MFISLTAVLPGRPHQRDGSPCAGSQPSDGAQIHFSSHKRLQAWKKSTFQGLQSFDTLRSQRSLSAIESMPTPCSHAYAHPRPVGTAMVTLEYNTEGAYTPHHTVGTMFKSVSQEISKSSGMTTASASFEAYPVPLHPAVPLCQHRKEAGCSLRGEFSATRGEKYLASGE